MPNIKSIITSHNKKIIHKITVNQPHKTCNCMKKENCPLNNECLSTGIVYEATLKAQTPNYTEKKYIGICETTFKKRYANHKQSFETEKYRNSTTLSTEYWKLKETDAQPSVSWKIVKKANAYTPETKNCALCLNEKYEIANAESNKLLNKRNELIAKCRHKRKFLLSIHDTND